jgi:hypothetical protein
LALSLVSILFALEKQLGIYRQRIEELFRASSRPCLVWFFTGRRT